MSPMQKSTVHRYERDRYANEKQKGQSGSQKRGHVHTLQTGQEYDVTIEILGHNGDGLCHVDDYTVFVPNTEKGEKVRIRIKKVKDTIAFADRL